MQWLKDVFKGGGEGRKGEARKGGAQKADFPRLAPAVTTFCNERSFGHRTRRVVRRKLSFSSVTLEKLGSREARQQRERERAHTAKWEREVQFLKSRSSALLILHARGRRRQRRGLP